jgi:hypothetical protein
VLHNKDQDILFNENLAILPSPQLTLIGGLFCFFSCGDRRRARPNAVAAAVAQQRGPCPGRRWDLALAAGLRLRARAIEKLLHLRYGAGAGE